MLDRSLPRVLRSDSPALIVLAQVLGLALSFISAPIVARTLGPAGRGQTASALALFLLVPVILSLGMPLEVRRHSATSNGVAVTRAARGVSVALLPLAGGIALAADRLLFVGCDSAFRVTAAVGVLLAPATIAWMCDASVLVAHQSYRRVAALRIVQPAVYVASLVCLWIADLVSPALVLLANLLGTAGTFGLGLFLNRARGQARAVRISTFLQASIRYWGSSIAEAASGRLDQVLALPLLGAYQAGIYSVSAMLAAIPTSLSQAIGASTFAPIARAPLSERKQAQTLAIRRTSALALVSCLLVAIGGSIVIPMLFGRQFLPAVAVTALCLVGTACYMCSYVGSLALAAVGLGGRMTVSQILALVVAVACLLIFGPDFGAIGAALASSVGYISLLAVVLTFLKVRVRAIVPAPRDFSDALSMLLARRNETVG